ncbi:MAG: hypothetical protein Roseis2KO_51700 [Roseivirga sp.]
MQAQIENMSGTMNKPMTEIEQYKSTQGSPYFLSEFKSGTIIDKDGRVHKVFLKYDTYQEEVELFNDGKTFIIDDKIYPKFTIEYIDEKMGKMVKYTFTNEIKIPGLNKLKYSLVLADGENMKLVKVIQTYLNESQDSGYGGIVQPHRFETKEIYFLLKDNGESYEVKTNNKSVLKAFNNDPSLKSYFKKERVKIRKEEDLVEVAQYLDSIGE